ncbi:uncharacterized protein LOC133922916 [Phragmites australis]|uniref:uncharacterized protein LOC133922916 n=1 Tax=Phragmites australis TaxID=29695 RepID=UPI002D78C865|nr:uncharacterized protein LOC133922916 [Phragmites australis]
MMVKNHRTLTCAPTNTAVVEVASRILSLLEDSSRGGSSGRKCFLSDVVLFGNEDRMSVNGNLAKIFLDSRIRRLRECLMPGSGWTQCLSSMLRLLERPLVQYDRYVEEIDNEIKEELNNKSKKIRKIEKMSFKAYFMSNYKRLENDLRYCVETFRDDLPRSTTSEGNFRCMTEVPHLLNVFQNLLLYEPDEQLQALFKSEDERYCPLFLNLVTQVHDGVSLELKEARSSCLQKLRELSDHFELPDMFDSRSIEEFLLQRAKSVLCTASSSYRLHYLQKAQTFEVLVVDEAAQLKESESLIPLQLPGVRHAVLIGDEYQLPALVKSKVARSLFVYYFYCHNVYCCYGRANLIQSHNRFVMTLTLEEASSRG